MLFILAVGFVPGSPLPPCLVAADVDGNQTFSPLVDALFGLNAAFLPGSPLPPPPFSECGDDPNGIEVLGCSAPDPVCN